MSENAIERPVTRRRLLATGLAYTKTMNDLANTIAGWRTVI